MGLFDRVERWGESLMGGITGIAGSIGGAIGGLWDSGEEWAAPSLGQPIDLGARLERERGGGFLPQIGGALAGFGERVLSGVGAGLAGEQPEYPGFGAGLGRVAGAIGRAKIEDIISGPSEGAVVNVAAATPGAGGVWGGGWPSLPAPLGGPRTSLPTPMGFGTVTPTVRAQARDQTGGLMAIPPAAALPGGAGIQQAGLLGGLLGQFLPEPFGGGGVQLPALPFGGALYSIRGPRMVPRRLVMQQNPVTGTIHFWKLAGRPILFSGDLATARRVQKLARRARRSAGGR